MRDMLAFVVQAVQDAAILLQKEVQRPGGPRGKGLKAPIDAEIGAFLTQRLGLKYPDATIICEEGGSQEGDGKRAFWVDPNDGTRDFLMGYRENSISVGLVEDGQHKLSVIYAPFSTDFTGQNGMLVTWAEGEPIRHNGEEVKLPPAPTKIDEDSLILISTRVQGGTLLANQQLLAPARLEYCPSIATRLALVAIGKAVGAGTARNPLSPWDFAAAQGLLQAAGGDLLGEHGQPITWNGIHPTQPAHNIYFGARNTDLAAEIVHRLTPLLQARNENQ